MSFFDFVWHLDGRISPVIVTARYGAGDERLENTLSPDLAAREVEEWFADPLSRPCLVEIFDQLFGSSVLRDGRPADEMRQVLVPAIEQAFRDQRLIAVRQAPVSVGSGMTVSTQPEAPPAPSPRQQTSRETDWISIELLDEDKRGVAFERYRITASDGTVREGRLNESGVAYVEGIAPGECEVEFLDLDGAAWSAA